MPYRICWALLAVLGGSVMAANAQPRESPKASFYVAPGGNDRWSGRLRAPNGERSDGPFASLGRARDAVRQLRQGGASRQPVTVLLRGGTYFLGEPVLFIPEDSASEAAPVTFAAYPGEKPVLSGGRRIANWKPVTIDGRDLWAADVPAGWSFRELWVEDAGGGSARRGRARHPNQGYLKVAEIPGSGSESPWDEGQTAFRFAPGDLKAWETATDAELRVMSRWVESHLPIAAIDEGKREVRFAKRSVFRLDPGDPYYVENAREILDEPGEWYLDSRAGRLYYMPLPEERDRRAGFAAVAPALPQLLRLEGKPESGQYVEHLVFRGLTFAHSEWWFPDQRTQAGGGKPERGGFSQAAVGVPGAIFGAGARRCAFEGCAFAHLGTYGLELARGCSENRVAACDFVDLGAGGIKIGETQIRENPAEQAHGNHVSDCRIAGGGRVFHSAVGIWIGQSGGNRIAHNEIRDFYYSGISIGWTWGYGKTLARENVVEANHVHHIGRLSGGDGPILSDMGGIYTLGVQPGTVIRGNFFHDVAGRRYGGWGIYFDEGSTGIVAEGNLVTRTTHGGFHQHYGRENVLRSNVFAYGRDAQLQATRPEEHLRFTFEGNIILWREGELLAGDVSDLHVRFDRNLYWREKDPADLRFGGLTLEEWHQKGMDRSSQVADPLFANPEKDDFTLKPDSPALRLGFRALNLKDVGPRPAARNAARHG